MPELANFLAIRLIEDLKIGRTARLGKFFVFNVFLLKAQGSLVVHM